MKEGKFKRLHNVYFTWPLNKVKLKGETKNQWCTWAVGLRRTTNDWGWVEMVSHSAGAVLYLHRTGDYMILCFSQDLLNSTKR